MASLIDAALGKSSAPAPAPAAASSSSEEPTPTYNHVGPVWGSFERNTGTWTPYSPTENALIQAAFDSNVLSVSVPTCFNATVHFEHHGGNHYQMTPAVGSKPPGFRSVLRGRAGDKATLYWWEDQRLWRLEQPVAGPITHTQQVLIHPPAETDAFAWQWCDLTGRDAADAREINWHPYAPDHGSQVEEAWSRKVELVLTIGVTSYKIANWQGAYGQQTNLTTGVSRQVRRGRTTVLAATPADYVDDSCALCTEKFTDTPEWPLRRTPCGHAFHWTCLQHVLRQRAGTASRCPMCRTSLAGMSPSNTMGSLNSSVSGSLNGSLSGSFSGLSVGPSQIEAQVHQAQIAGTGGSPSRSVAGTGGSPSRSAVGATTPGAIGNSSQAEAMERYGYAPPRPTVASGLASGLAWGMDGMYDAGR